ncbi:type I restriction enzyme HsdR N-terminal domain-containing protein [Thermococcus atlanticus]
MDELRDTVSEVVLKINTHRELYMRNEEAVKQHLIGHVFRTLGWEWDNPFEVRPEEKTEDGRADYALILDGNVFAYVEAKNLGVNIIKNGKPLRQLGRYCFNTGVRYGILTNGAVWIVLRAFEEGSRLSDRILLKVNLENEPLERSTLKLSLLSKARIREIEKLSALLKAFELSFNGLRNEGFGEDVLIAYLRAGRSSLIPVDKLTGVETPRTAYINENGWKALPLGEQSLRGVLFAVLMYLYSRKEGAEKEEIKRVYEHLRRIRLEPSQILALLKTIEEEEGMNIAVEL